MGIGHNGHEAIGVEQFLRVDYGSRSIGMKQ